MCDVEIVLNVWFDWSIITGAFSHLSLHTQEYNLQQQQQQAQLAALTTVHDPVMLSASGAPTVVAEENLVERTLLSIQEKVRRE